MLDQSREWNYGWNEIPNQLKTKLQAKLHRTQLSVTLALPANWNHKITGH